jgi:Na+-transporting NADH:ubiquinone oxidoreductase subunit C
VKQSNESPAKNKDSVSHTLFMAFIVSLVCSVLVSTTVIVLRPIQRQARLTYTSHQYIIQLLNTLPGIQDADEAMGKLNMKLLDLENGEYVTGMDPADFDAEMATKDPETSIEIPFELDLAGIERRARYAIVYLLQGAGDTQYIILPVYGVGMWSLINAYIALEADANTIAGLVFYDHGETPGIGDRIEDPDWLRQWQGKQLYQDGQLHFEVVRRIQSGAEQFQVNAISGATLTSVGVSNMVQYWLGPHGFKTYLDNIRNTE